MHLYGYCESENFKFDYKDGYLKLRSILIPELANENYNCSLGIWNVKTNSLAKSAYDMQQIIRYTQAWYIHPEGGIGVDFNTPILEGDLSQIRCECHGDSIKGKSITLYAASFLSNAIIKEIKKITDAEIKIIYGNEDSRPMYISYRGFKTEKEAKAEMKNIISHKEKYVSALTVVGHIEERRAKNIDIL